MKKLLIICSLLAIVSSCYYDNASEMYPAAGLNVNCDTIDVTYNEHLVPLFQANCGTNNSCHSAAYAEGGVVLDSYEAASAVDDITMLGCINHESGYVQMPPAGKMGDCGINQVTLWILNGKPE